MAAQAGVLILAVALGTAAEARAQNDYSWCVDAAGTVTDWAACGEAWVCDGTVTSVADALAAAAATPDFVPDVRPENHTFCVATPGAHTESIHVENGDGVLGGNLLFKYVGTAPVNGCPAPLGGEPMFLVEGDAQSELDHAVSVLGLRVDAAFCPGLGRLGDIEASAFEVVDSRFEGGAGPFLAAEQPAPEIRTRVRNSRIAGVAGPLYQGNGRFFLDGSEVSRVESGSASLIAVEGLGAGLEVSDSAIFGNVTRGAPMIATESDVLFKIVTVAGNVLMEGAPLLRPTPVEHDRTVGITLDECVFSRNRFLTSGGATVAPAASWGPPVGNVGCLPSGADDRPYFDRPLPAASAPAAGAALVHLTSTQLRARWYVALLKSAVVQNELAGDGALFRVDGAVDDARVAWIHSTVDEPNAALIDGGGSGADAGFVSARNLFLQPPTHVLGPAWTRVEATMDEVHPQFESTQAFHDTLEGVVGPYPGRLGGDPSAWFRNAADVRALPTCSRGTLMCPEYDFDCVGDHWFCALDVAAEYVPTDELVDALEIPWPWTGEMDLETVFDPGGMVPGASGWRCEVHNHPWDTERPGGSTNGDADQFTNLIDCDNLDDGVQPVHPDEDGIMTPDCRPVKGACYRCPDGTEVEGDDDDSAPQDDDDAADDDDSVSPEPTPDPGGSSVVRPSCGTSGCGVHYTCEGGRIVTFLAPMFLLGGARRRRR